MTQEQKMKQDYVANATIERAVAAWTGTELPKGMLHNLVWTLAMDAEARAALNTLVAAEREIAEDCIVE